MAINCDESQLPCGSSDKELKHFDSPNICFNFPLFLPSPFPPSSVFSPVFLSTLLSPGFYLSTSQ